MPSGSARKRVRRFLDAPSTRETPATDELLHRRWENGGGGAAYDLRVSDLRALLRRLDASRAEVRTLTDLYRKEQEKLREQGDAAARLVQENKTLRNTVSELSKKIADPPGSHERWAELRQKNTSLVAQRDQLQLQNSSLRKSLTDARIGESLYPNTMAYLQKTVRELRENLARAEDRNATQAETIERLSTELADLRKQAPEGTVSYLRKENQQLRAELDTLRKERGEARGETDSYKEALEKALRAIRAELAEAKRDKAATLSDLLRWAGL